MQKNGCNIAEAAELWLQLANEDIIKRNCKAKHSIAARSEVIFASGAFFAANLLDPRFQGKQLNPGQKKVGLHFLDEQVQLRTPAASDAVGSSITKLLSDGLPTPFHNGATSAQWWRANGVLGNFPLELVDIACKLLESTASSAGLERAFSTTKWIQSKLRNGLSMDRVKMLAVCARSLRGADGLSVANTD